MPRYLVITKSFINNSIVEEGEIIEYDGKAGSNLELVKGKAKAESKSETQDNLADGVFKEGE
jgi:hypothetical protein